MRLELHAYGLRAGPDRQRLSTRLVRADAVGHPTSIAPQRSSGLGSAISSVGDTGPDDGFSGKRVWGYSCTESVCRLKMGVTVRIRFLRPAGRQHGLTDGASGARRAIGVDDVSSGLIVAEHRAFRGGVTECRASS